METPDRDRIRMRLDCDIQRGLFTRIKLDFPEYDWDTYCVEVAELYRMIVRREVFLGVVDWEGKREDIKSILPNSEKSGNIR